MCGIVGVATIETSMSMYDDVLTDLFKQMLFADTFRGKDSTGVFTWREGMDQPETWKKALAAPDFLQLKTTKRLLDSRDDWNVMVGHNRAATLGGVNHVTAHPFTHGPITLVHNGTLRNHKALPGGKDFDVDSEAVCNAFANNDVKDIIKQINGAFTFVWFDQRDGSLNIVRNDERPMYIAPAKKESSLVFGSEGAMVRWIAGRTGLELAQGYVPKPGQWLKFHPHKDFWDWHTKPEHIQCELAPSFQAFGGYSGNTWTGYETAKKKAGKGKNPDKSGTITASLLEPYELEKGDPVWLSEFKWTPYVSNNTKKSTDLYGQVTGRLDEIGDAHVAVIHGIKESEYLVDMKGGDLHAFIETAYEQQGVPVVTLVNNSWTVYEKNWDEAADAEVMEVVTDDAHKEEGSKSIEGPFRKISVEEFTDLTKYGCCYCQGNIFLSDADRMAWTLQGDAICPSCVDEGYADFEIAKRAKQH